MTGLFLGAGASFEAGLPLVWDLTNELRNWLSKEKLLWINANMRISGNGWPDEVIEEFSVVLLNRNMHYESLLGFLETHYQQTGPFQQKYFELYGFLIELVGYLLYLRHSINGAYITEGLRYIDGVIGLAETELPLWIFSLNHDVVIECLAAEYQIPISCGFTAKSALHLRDARGASLGELPIETLVKADLDSGSLTFIPNGSRGINLLKIHGALNVFTYNDSKDVMRLIPDASNAAEVLDGLTNCQEHIRLLNPHSGLPVKLKTPNEVVYTNAENGIEIFRRSLLAGAFKFDARRSQTLPQVYLKLVAAYLNEVSSLICIGYSFGDDHINLVIRDWLEFARNRHLTAVSPQVKAVPPPFLHLSPQVTITNATATAYLEHFSPRLLSDAEKRRRDERASQRDEKRSEDGFA